MGCTVLCWEALSSMHHHVAEHPHCSNSGSTAHCRAAPADLIMSGGGDASAAVHSTLHHRLAGKMPVP